MNFLCLFKLLSQFALKICSSEFTILFSANLERIGVTDIWWKSYNEVGCGTLGTGVIIAVSHVPVQKELLKIAAMTSASSNEQLR